MEHRVTSMESFVDKLAGMSFVDVAKEWALWSDWAYYAAIKRDTAKDELTSAEMQLTPAEGWAGDSDDKRAVTKLLTLQSDPAYLDAKLQSVTAERYAKYTAMVASVVARVYDAKMQDANFGKPED